VLNVKALLYIELFRFVSFRRLHQKKPYSRW